MYVGVPPKFLKKTRKQLGHKNLAPVPSKFSLPFQVRRPRRQRAPQAVPRGSRDRVEIRERVAGCVLVNPNLRALSMYILVVLLVSAALRSVLVTNSLAQTYDRSLGTAAAVYRTYLLVVLLVSAALRSVLATNSFATTYNRSLDTTAVYGTYL